MSGRGKNVDSKDNWHGKQNIKKVRNGFFLLFLKTKYKKTNKEQKDIHVDQGWRKDPEAEKSWSILKRLCIGKNNSER